MTFEPKFFNPAACGGQVVDEKDGVVKFTAGTGERPEDTYLYSPRIILALNVALATNRPLLISGEPGSGKTFLAHNAAAVLGWWWFKHMVTSRITASDILWTFDALGRLNDANLKGEDLPDKHNYVEPGTLWWAFDPKTAESRGHFDAGRLKSKAKNPGYGPIESHPRPVHHDKAVVLLDEIDKADPDVPNDLLGPLDRKIFTIRETGDRIEMERDVLLIMTTNGERELPQAFMRRCVSLTLDPPDKDWFLRIANEKNPDGDPDLHEAVAEQMRLYREAARKRSLRQPSTAEFLDALHVCRELSLDTRSKAWRDVAASVLWKHDQRADIDNGESEESSTDHDAQV